jgi:short-subunit dehydrogenase
VAGDRGRQSNYIYGAAKGAITIVLQGMRNRLHHAGVTVVTIKLGRVDTPMTASFEKGLTWARPESVAPSIYRAITRGRDVVYIPAYWRAIMLVLRSIPESVFKKLRL